MDDEDQKRHREFPELNPDGTRMTEEDRAANKGRKRREEPKPWAPPPRRNEE